MKFLLSSFIAASWLQQSSYGFVVMPPSSSSTIVSSQTALFGSRAAQKKASRTQWIEKRGGMAEAGSASSGEGSAGLMTNDAGLEYVKLVHPDTGASSEVYLYGGVVTSYKDGDGTEFIAVRPDAKMDGSKPISGGLSHCWPQVKMK